MPERQSVYVNPDADWRNPFMLLKFTQDFIATPLPGNVRIDTPLSIVAGWGNADPAIKGNIVC